MAQVESKKVCRTGQIEQFDSIGVKHNWKSCIPFRVLVLIQDKTLLLVGCGVLVHAIHWLS